MNSDIRDLRRALLADDYEVNVEAVAEALLDHPLGQILLTPRAGARSLPATPAPRRS
jgi:hypothetical protein